MIYCKIELSCELKCPYNFRPSASMNDLLHFRPFMKNHMILQFEYSAYRNDLLPIRTTRVVHAKARHVEYNRSYSLFPSFLHCIFSKYSPPTATHFRSLSTQARNAPFRSFFDRRLRHWKTANPRAARVWKRRPASCFFKYRNRKKSQRARTGECRGCGRVSIFCSWRYVCTSFEQWTGAFSCKSFIPRIPAVGRVLL